jgi:hypothetical protein
MSDKPQLHFSGLSTLWQCGIKFEFRYVKKLHRSPTGYLHVGTAVDAAANADMSAKIETDALLPKEEVKQIARDTIVHRIDTEGITPDPDESEHQARDKGIDKAVRLTDLYATKLAPKLRPKAVQKKWALEIPGFDFDVVGTRDLDEVDDTIRDLKTSKRTPPDGTARKSLQLTTYTLAKYAFEKKLPPKVVLDTLVDLKTGAKSDTQASIREKEDFNPLLERIDNALTVIKTGVFTPSSPDRDFLCSPVYCEFWDQCKFVRMPKSFNVPQGE